MPTAAKGKYSGERFGSVKLLEKIGAGGMGEVYKGYHEIMQIDVAVKLVHPHLAESEEFIARFLREAQTTISLTHPNILRVYTAERWERVFYMVLEYIDGTDLRRVIRKRQRLPWQATIPVIGQTAAGLAHAHSKTVVHRDIKPENLLMTRKGEVKIADFGLATAAQAAAGRLTATGQIMGSPLYMSPEQAEAKDLTSRSDIYSLGASWYQMLTGTPPFTAPTVAGILAAHVTRDVAFPPQRFEGVPGEVLAVLRAMLKRNVDERLGDCRLIEEVCKAMMPGAGGRDGGNTTAIRKAVRAAAGQGPSETTSRSRRDATSRGEPASPAAGSASAVATAKNASSSRGGTAERDSELMRIDPALYMGLDSGNDAAVPEAAAAGGLGGSGRTRYMGASYDLGRSTQQHTRRQVRSRAVASGPNMSGSFVASGPVVRVRQSRFRTLVLAILAIAVLAFGGLYVYREFVQGDREPGQGDGSDGQGGLFGGAGYWIVIADPEDRSSDLRLFRINEETGRRSKPVTLSHTPQVESWPRFGPLGEKIAYVATDGAGGGEASIIDRLTRRPRQLTNSTRRPEQTTEATGPLSWHQAGGMEISDYDILVPCELPAGYRALSRITPAGRYRPLEGFPITDLLQFELSPVGDIGVVISGDPNVPSSHKANVVSYPAGDLLYELPVSQSGPKLPRVNVDGTRVALLRTFTSDGEALAGVANLITVNIDGTDWRLHEDAGYVYGAVWHPDGLGRLIVSVETQRGPGGYTLSIYDPAAPAASALTELLDVPLSEPIREFDACRYGNVPR